MRKCGSTRFFINFPFFFSSKIIYFCSLLAIAEETWVPGIFLGVFHCYYQTLVVLSTIHTSEVYSSSLHVKFHFDTMKRLCLCVCVLDFKK